MQLGIVGLGRMGLAMARRLIRAGHDVAGTAKSAESMKALEASGGRPSRNLKELITALDPPRLLWLMVPAGKTVDSIVGQATPGLAKGDLIVDGGNSNYHDSLRRADHLRSKGIGFVDVGIGGGVWGSEHGYCLMAGGDDGDFHRIEPVLRDLAADGGYLHTGPIGSGHYAKMVHEAMHYGMLQAFGEGFELLARSRYHFDLKALTHAWNRGGLIRSYTLELAEAAFEEDPRMSEIRGWVEDSGEGRWAVRESLDLEVPVPALTVALQARLASRQEDSFSAKIVAALRHRFGGHAVKKAD